MEIVAQLVRASVCGTEGRGFETPRSPLKIYKPCFSKQGFFIKNILDELVASTYPVNFCVYRLDH